MIFPSFSYFFEYTCSNYKHCQCMRRRRTRVSYLILNDNCEALSSRRKELRGYPPTSTAKYSRENGKTRGVKQANKSATVTERTWLGNQSA